MKEYGIPKMDIILLDGKDILTMSDPYGEDFFPVRETTTKTSD